MFLLQLILINNFSKILQAQKAIDFKSFCRGHFLPRYILHMQIMPALWLIKLIKVESN